MKLSNIYYSILLNHNNVFHNYNKFIGEDCNPFFCPFNIDSYNLLNNHQFRQLDHSTLEKISSELEITITSDWLTIEGLSRTFETYENIQDELRDKIKLESIKS